MPAALAEEIARYQLPRGDGKPRVKNTNGGWLRENRKQNATGPCFRPPHEVLLTSIIGGLLVEGRVPPGSIVDVGANRGIWACYYASVAPERNVHAIDPDPRYIECAAVPALPCATSSGAVGAC